MRVASLALLLIVFSGACMRPRELGSAPVFERGFMMYPSPRTFDPPGTVFRIDDRGVRHLVADLSAMLTVAARAEAVPTITVRSAFDAEAFFSWLGGSAARLGLSRIDTATVAIVGARREQAAEAALQLVADSGVKLVDWRRTGKVFLITEAVLADSVHVMLTRLISLSESDSGQSPSGRPRGVAVSWLPQTRTTLSLRFTEPHRVLYKAEQLTRGTRLEPADQERALRIKVAEPLYWAVDQ